MLLGLVVACVLAATALLVIRARNGDTVPAAAADAATTSSSTSTTEPPTFAPGTAPTTTTTTAPPTTTTTAPPVPEHDLRPYAGLGAWIDVYDWSDAFNQGTPKLTTADIDKMAREGVQTLFVQTSKSESPTDILEPERVLPLINRAVKDGMDVVAWYLPTFEDEPLDAQRLIAAARIPGVKSIAVDIESEKVKDVAERTKRLLALTSAVREALPKETIGAIVYPPVVTDVLNTSIWPNFPWMQLKPFYDVWMPMSYQSFRSAGSPDRNAYSYTVSNIDRLRAHLRDTTLPVHTIGGIADSMNANDVRDMLRGAAQEHALGGSVYDYKTTGDALWPALRGFRRP